MHQTKKGNQWYFGLKAHIGLDKDSGLVHTLVTTSANISDISQMPVLLHGQEQAVWLDAGYVGVGHASAARPLKSWPKNGGKDWCTPTRNSRSK